MDLNLKAKIVLRYGNQSNFAQAVKVDESLVSRVLHGRKTLSEDQRKKWAMALGTKPEKLFDEN